MRADAGLGEAAEAAALVRYANAPVNTSPGRLRAANGHPEPYGIVLWVPEILESQRVLRENLERKGQALEEAQNVIVLKRGRGTGFRIGYASLT